MKSQPEDWRKAHQDNGFVVVPGLLDANTLSRLCEGMEQIIGHPERLPVHLRERLFFERDHIRNHPQYYPDLSPDQCGNSVREIAELPLFDPIVTYVLCIHRCWMCWRAFWGVQSSAFAFSWGVPKPLGGDNLTLVARLLDWLSRQSG
jgi:hypothetical protein